MAVGAWWMPLPPGVILVFNAVAMFLVAAVIARQLVTMAWVVTLKVDGTLVLRCLRELRTHAARVQRVRFSMLVSSSRAPIVLETADGPVRLVLARGEVDELATAIRRHHPDLVVEL
jgi:hypothetical protein